MLGYYENEEATKKALDDGWLHTGDYGYIDEDGFIFVTGRKSDIIVLRNGKNIYPQEIEFLINKLPYVAENMVYAREKSKTDTLLCAKIVYNEDTIKEKLGLCRESGCFAIAMDIDAAGLPFLKNMTPPAGSKTTEELKKIAESAGVPFIVKGIMTAKGARKAAEAGAAAIVVSNHGGRVLDQCPATAEVLPEIVRELAGSGVRILVDGGIRSGADVFKALALGADGVLICRPFVPAVYGAGEEGVKAYIDKIGGELQDVMEMCGAKNLSQIDRTMIRMSERSRQS